MKRFISKSAMVGAFLGVIILTCFAARYEDLAVTKLTVLGNQTVAGTLGVTGALTASGGVVGDVTGAIPVQSTSISTSTNFSITSASYGKAILLNTNAAVTITLPANGAAVGSQFEVSVIGNDSCAPTISAATADTLIGPNDVDLDSVTWATGHRINATARFWSDGSFWHVQNLGGTTMTYTD